jgi:DNA repair photolyase
LKASQAKKDALRRLLRDLERLPPGALINVGTSSDPYPPEEDELGLTRSLLEAMIPLGFRVLITTKGVTYAYSDLELIASGNVAVTPTITMLDPSKARLVEPGAPTPQERIAAARRAVKAGVPVGVRVDPIIPYVNDDEWEIRELIGRLWEAGVRFIVTSTYKARPDNLARMREALGEVGARLYRLYRNRGVRMHGYIYLPEDMRMRLLRPVIREAARLGMEYATCREGFKGREWFNAGSCDGSHLIPMRIKPKSFSRGLDRWLRP